LRPRTIVVAAAQVPFQRGGAEWHVQALASELGKRGFLAEVVQLPFQWDPRREVLRSTLAWRLLDLSRAGGLPVDLVIATRFPSYALRHPRKVVWLFHPFRQAYDLHDAGIDGFHASDEERALRERVIELDTRLLHECRRLFTTSRNNAARLRRYNGLEAEVLRLPLQHEGTYRREAFDGYVLSVGRLEALKRTELLIRALPQLPQAARAVVVGEGSERETLERLADELRMRSRVEFAGYVDEQRLKALYARCSAVFYAPYDEDYGLVTLEAFASGKPVVTTRDAGGPLEFVRDGETGLVCENEPLAIGQALSRLLTDTPLAMRLGENGRATLQGISWDDVVEKLTQL
jgi:glycosyltransferase involved in cell wall biosynthesis